MSSEYSQMQISLNQENSLIQESPLIQVNFSKQNFAESNLRIHEMAFRGLVNLRGSLDNPDFVKAVEGVLNTSLKMQNNSFVETKEFTILWFGPTEWMIVTAAGKEAELVAALRASLAETFAAVTDVSGGNTIIEISGSCVRELLACGSMVDFHENEFSQGQCVQTLFAKTNVAVYQTGQEDIFRMIVRRSFSDYLGSWLVDAQKSLSNAE
ncbi:MAG: sarcosine oxidase subunit gamma [Dinoroseobacter sp.]|jgi:sarcosine oxidase subunit gamma